MIVFVIDVVSVQVRLFFQFSCLSKHEEMSILLICMNSIPHRQERQEEEEKKADN